MYIYIHIYTYVFFVGNQLTNCRNQISEFKETILRLKNKTEINRQELIKAFNQMKYKLAEREDASLNSGLGGFCFCVWWFVF